MLNVIYPCWHYNEGNPYDVKGLDALLCVAVLYTGLFSPCVIFALLHLWRLRPVLNSPGCSCVKRDIICDNWNPPVLNSFSDNEDEWGEKKTGRIFPCIPYIFSLYYGHVFVLETTQEVCETINAPECRALGLHYTQMPNVFNHPDLATAKQFFDQFNQQSCSERAVYYTCLMVFPMCDRITGSQKYACQEDCYGIL